MGLFIGVPLSIIARVGSRLPLAARDLVRPVAVMLGVMAAFAVVAFAVGYFAGYSLLPRFDPDFASDLSKGELGNVPDTRVFIAVYFAHNASYFAGAVGGIALVFYAALVRWGRKTPPASLKSRGRGRVSDG